MSRSFPWRKTVFCLCLLPFLGGCAAGGVKYHDQNMDFGAIRSVAVMPFANLSREQTAGERVRDTFSTMLLASGSIYVIPPGEVARGIARAGIADPSAPSAEEVKKFAGVTEVDAVITGVVKEYGEVRSGSTSANVISVSVRMLDRESGAVIWTAASTQGGIGASERLFGGGGKPMEDVARKAIDELLDNLFQ